MLARPQRVMSRIVRLFRLWNSRCRSPVRWLMAGNVVGDVVGKGAGIDQVEAMESRISMVVPSGTRAGSAVS